MYFHYPLTQYTILHNLAQKMKALQKKVSNTNCRNKNSYINFCRIIHRLRDFEKTRFPRLAADT